MKYPKFSIKWLTAKETRDSTINVIIMATFTTIFTASISTLFAYLIGLL